MGIEPRVSAVAASGVLGLIGQCGGDSDRIFGAARLDMRQVGDASALLDLRRYCDLFEHAARQTNVADFGLRFGNAYRLETMGALGLLAVNSPTLGAALRNVCAYFPAIQEHSTLQLQEDGDLLRLEYQIRDGRIARRRQDAELSIGIFNNLFRRCFGAGWSPLEIHFEHLRAAEIEDMQSLLNAPVYFAQASNAIVFRGSALDAVMPGANAALLPPLQAELGRRAAQARPDDFTGRVIQEIRRGFAAGDASIGAVAAQLGLSRTMLYRRLAGLEIDFSRLTQAVRQELAVMYAGQNHIAFTDIAELLGYSELSAFSRAFKRWTGLSPAAYRAATTAR